MDSDFFCYGLVVLLVGENPASQIYVRNKERVAKEIGIHSSVERYPETISENELLAEIEKYNQDPRFFFCYAFFISYIDLTGWIFPYQ